MKESQVHMSCVTGPPLFFFSFLFLSRFLWGFFFLSFFSFLFSSSPSVTWFSQLRLKLGCREYAQLMRRNSGEICFAV